MHLTLNCNFMDFAKMKTWRFIIQEFKRCFPSMNEEGETERKSVWTKHFISINPARKGRRGNNEPVKQIKRRDELYLQENLIRESNNNSFQLLVRWAESGAPGARPSIVFDWQLTSLVRIIGSSDDKCFFLLSFLYFFLSFYTLPSSL